MIFLLNLIMTALTLSILLLSVALLVSQSGTKNYHKNSPFECGFLPHNKQRKSFSIQFFLIALIFLIFDVEVIILFPMLAENWYLMESAVSLSVFLLILLAGLFIEWSQSSLEWQR